MPCLEHKSKKKGDCPSCFVCRCCPPGSKCVMSYEHIALGARGKKKRPRDGDVGFDTRRMLYRGRMRELWRMETSDARAREELIVKMNKQNSVDDDVDVDDEDGGGGVTRVYVDEFADRRDGDGAAAASSKGYPKASTEEKTTATKGPPETWATEMSTPAQTARRKRGRPARKDAASAEPPSTELGATSPPKRKRGRPRKNPAESSDESSHAPKRKRGRPRKVKVSEEATQGDRPTLKLPPLPTILQERLDAAGRERADSDDANEGEVGSGDESCEYGEEKRSGDGETRKTSRGTPPERAQTNAAPAYSLMPPATFKERLRLSAIRDGAVPKDKLCALCNLLGLPTASLQKMPKYGFDPKVFSGAPADRRRAKTVYLSMIDAIERLLCPEHPSVVREEILGVGHVKYDRGRSRKEATMPPVVAEDATPVGRAARKLEASKEKLLRRTVRLALVGAHGPATVASSLLAGSYRQRDLRKILSEASAGGTVKRIDMFDRKAKQSRGEWEDDDLEEGGGETDAVVHGAEEAEGDAAAALPKEGVAAAHENRYPATGEKYTDVANLSDVMEAPASPPEPEEIPVPPRRQNMGDMRFSTLRKTHALLQTGQPIPQRSYAYRVNPDSIRTAIAFLQQRLPVPRTDILRKIEMGGHDLGSVPVCERGVVSMDQLFGEYRGACEVTGMAEIRVGLPTFAQVVELMTGTTRGHCHCGTGRQSTAMSQSHGGGPIPGYGLTFGV